MTIKHRIFLLSALCSAFSAGAAGISIECSPGQLLHLLGENVAEVSDLTVTGALDVRDIETMRAALPALASVDLSGAKVMAYRSEDPDWMNRCYFSEDTFPAYSFHNSAVTSIILPSSLVCIEEGAFAGSALKKVVIGKRLKSIGDWAFVSTAIYEVTLPEVESMGKGVFENCSRLERADLSEVRFRTLPERTFAGASSLALLSLSENVDVIGNEAFIASGLKEIDLSQIPDVGDFAFADSSIRDITLSDAVVARGEFFNAVNIQEIKGTVSEVGEAGFAGCTSLFKAFTVYNSHTLGDWALADIIAPQIYLGSALREMGKNVFSHSTRLRDIDVTQLGAAIPSTDPDAFLDIEQGKILLHVAPGSEEIWRAHPQWGLFDITTKKTGIDEALIAAAPSVSFLGYNLIIDSPETLGNVVVTDQDGLLIADLNPGADRVSVDTSSSAAKVFVVRMVFGDKTGTVKILRPRAD